jgi:hypothetical protein
MELHRIALMILWRSLFCGAVSWIAFAKLGVVGGVCTVALWGLMLAKPIMELTATWFNWAKREPYAKWQGNYYEFANIQIRVFVQPDGLWFCDRDVLKVIEETHAVAFAQIYAETEYARLDNEHLHAFSETGVERLLRASSHYNAAPMLLWLTREVIKQHHRKLEIAAQEVNQQENENAPNPT